MKTEKDLWENSKKQAKELIKNKKWNNDIRFMMALRDCLQYEINKYNKKLENK